MKKTETKTDPHIIAVFTPEDFIGMQQLMPSNSWFCSVDYKEYCEAVEDSLASARTSGFEPKTIQIDLGSFTVWCDQNHLNPSDITISAYVRDRSGVYS